MRYFTFFLALCMAFLSNAQQTKHALFLGNSYTQGNNLPQLVADVALSLGDTLYYNSNTPGGYTLNGHSTNANSQSKIAQGGWDYVVLQEQSQLPSFPYGQFSTASLPYAITLGNQINTADSCTKPLFFMTWGRRDGDQSNCATWPPVCTYTGMQSLLRERYLEMADSVDGEVAPVGAVWRDMRKAFPNVELYTADKSHPNLTGSYLAACTFYTSMFHKSPVGAGHPFAVDSTVAFNIQTLAASTVLDSLPVWMIDTNSPQPSFAWTITNFTNCEVSFDASNAQFVDSVYWDFGDGTTGSGFQVTHQYLASGTYTVTAHGWRGCQVDSAKEFVSPCYTNIPEDQLLGIQVFPNPATNHIVVERHNQPIKGAQLRLYTIEGRCVLSSKNATLNLSDLAVGVYVLEVSIGTKTHRVKVLRAAK